jgi:hypothetical protein
VKARRRETVLFLAICRISRLKCAVGYKSLEFREKSLIIKLREYNSQENTETMLSE